MPTSSSLPSMRSSASQSTNSAARRRRCRRQHRAPAADLDHAAAMEAADHRLDARCACRSRARPPRLRAVRVEALAEHGDRRFKRAPARRPARAPRRQRLERRPQLGLDAVTAASRSGARASTWWRTSARKLSTRRSGRPSGEALRPALAGQDPRGHERCRRAPWPPASSPATRSSIRRRRPRARAAAAGLRRRAASAADRRSPARVSAEREGAVGRLEQMMALVEDIAGRQVGVVEPAERRLHHDQRVIGDRRCRARRARRTLFSMKQRDNAGRRSGCIRRADRRGRRPRRGRSGRAASRENRRRPCRRRASRRSSAPSGRAPTASAGRSGSRATPSS